MSQRAGSRIVLVSAILTLVAGGVGLVVSLVLNAFVFDEFDAYGEVPVPGSGTLHLPAGQVTVSFHTMVTGSPSGGFPIPELQFSITPPAGVAKPEVSESIGGTTTVNSDTRVRVWVVQVAQDGTYDVVADGKVSGYISPRLAFGHGSSYGWLPWMFAALLPIGTVGLIAALIWSARAGKKARPLAAEELSSFDAPTWTAGPTSVPAPVDSYTPTDQGMRLEQLKQLAALRDSGALTEDEYTAEKRRILES